MTRPTFTVGVSHGRIDGRAARRSISAAMPHYTYVVYDRRGLVVYVGMSSDPVKRLQAHRKTATWFDEVEEVECFRHPNRPTAAREEWRLIKTMQPKYNTVGVETPTVALPPTREESRLRHFFQSKREDAA